MSAADPHKAAAPLADLSPEARALLAELDAKTVVSDKQARNDALAAAFYDTDEAQSPPQDGVPILLDGRQPDAKASAFADLLEHLDDEVSTSPAAKQAAEKFQAERKRRSASLSTDTGDGDGADIEMSDTSQDMSGDAVILEEEVDESGAFDDFGGEFDGEFDADFDLELDEKPAGLLGFFKGLGKKSGHAVKRLVGVKDASAAYDAQSGASLLPYTIIRAVVLVLVAAVPPIVNLAVIQPQISDNNRKITETLSFQAKSTEDEKVADKLASSIVRVQKSTQTLMRGLMPEDDLQELVNKYVAALQRYDLELNSYNVGADASRKVIAGDQVQDAVIVELDLVSRYDVYAEIRKIFITEAKKVSVIEETIAAQPGSVDLAVTSRLMVPVRRAYDAELDKPEEGGK